MVKTQKFDPKLKVKRYSPEKKAWLEYDRLLIDGKMYVYSKVVTLSLSPPCVLINLLSFHENNLNQSKLIILLTLNEYACVLKPWLSRFHGSSTSEL